MGDATPDQQRSDDPAPVPGDGGDDRPGLPVVGIGASAGGLEAVSGLLRNAPADLGMAWVLVQHLDPSHESSLAALLSRVSPLPVREATEGLRLEPDQVYVIPPGSGMVLRDGCLHLTPREETREPRRPIDLFFRSLAEECGRLAVGVILSGTGSDGTAGLEVIRAEGGVTFAQDDSAAYDGMPASAVAAGCVDYVLPPEGIAEELVRISRHPSLSDPPASGETPAGSDEERGYDAVIRRLSDATGIDFSSYKPATLRRRIQRRMVVRRRERVDDYLALLDEEPGEIEALSADALINVTSFFRDPEVFQALEEKVLPALLEDRPDDRPIRIWVPGCATGEELYSLAICLLEFLGPRARGTAIKLFGTDVSERVVGLARAGHYPARVAADIGPERLDRFFVEEEGGYTIRKNVRDLCVFARHDATRDPPFSNLDLISCRNVLIYLGSALQQRLLPLFHYALREDGYLLLGTSEAIGPVPDLFTVVDRKHRIYAPRPVPSRLSFAAGESSEGPDRGRRPATPGPARDEPDLHREADRVLLARCAPPGVLVDETLEILHFRGDAGRFLAPGAGRPSNNLRRMAREGLFPELGEAIEEARARDAPAAREGLRMRGDDGPIEVSLEVFPIRAPLSTRRAFLVLFRRAAAATGTGTPQQSEAPRAAAGRTAQLERELASLDDYLRATVEEREAANEELRAANEELLSSNEELQSTNEELQTAHEELQATNEELLTVNEELQHRNEEATLLGRDLTNLLTSVEIPIIMLDADLRIRRFTPSAAKLLNLIPGDRDRSILDLRPKIDIPGLEELLGRVMETSTTEQREVRDEEGRWHSLWIRPLRGSGDELDGAVITLTDIDAIKRSEERQRAARDFAESIVAAMREPLLVLDRELRVVQANDAFRSAYPSVPVEIGAEGPTDAEGRRWLIPGLHGRLRELVIGGEPFEGLEVETEIPGLGRRIVRINARAVAGFGPAEPGQAGSAILLAVEDVTDRRREEAEGARLARRVEETQRLEALGVLAGGIAHDFNNILAAILGYASLLEEQLPEQPQLQRPLEQISEGARRAADLCRQMLAYSGRGRFLIRPIDLSSLVHDLTPLLRATTSKKAHFQFDLEDDLPAVLGDAAQLRQVAMNLMINASEALGDDPGEVVVRTGRTLPGGTELADARIAPEQIHDGEYVFLEVEDDGCGMGRETIERMFDPFFSRKFTGRGLGLAAVLGIVRGHQGALQVASEEGRGSKFRLLLPAADQPAEEPAKPAAPGAPWRGRGTVLIVDDEADVRTVLRKLCERSGLDVLEAADGREAVELLRARPDEVDLVLLDLTMPRMDGAETFRALRQVRPDLRALLMSGYDERESMARIDAPGLVGFLPKPFELGDVVAKLRAALDGD